MPTPFFVFIVLKNSDKKPFTYQHNNTPTHTHTVLLCDWSQQKSFSFIADFFLLFEKKTFFWVQQVLNVFVPHFVTWFVFFRLLLICETQWVTRMCLPFLLKSIFPLNWFAAFWEELNHCTHWLKFSLHRFLIPSSRWLLSNPAGKMVSKMRLESSKQTKSTRRAVEAFETWLRPQLRAWTMLKRSPRSWVGNGNWIILIDEKLLIETLFLTRKKRFRNVADVALLYAGSTRGKLDQISLILFPVSFLLFTIIYWVLYLNESRKNALWLALRNFSHFYNYTRSLTIKLFPLLDLSLHWQIFPLLKIEFL